MLRILIVDDEPFFLDFLSNYVNWADYQAEVIGTALNGLLAMNLLQMKPVDVVLTDIKMPVMDGIELISDATEKYPDLQFVALSSYSDFNMVGEAYKLGAREYLLKSEITREQLAEVLGRCAERKRKAEEQERRRAEQLEMFQYLSREVNRLESVVYKNRSILRKAFFNLAIDRNLSNRELLEERQASQMDLRTPPAALLLVRVREYPIIVRDFWQNDHTTLEFAFTNVLEEAASFLPAVSVFGRREGEFVLLLHCTEEDPFARIPELYERVTAALRRSFSVEATVSVSSRRGGAEGIARLYAQAEQAQLGGFLTGKRLLEYDEHALLPENADSGVLDTRQLADQFARQLMIGNIRELKNNLGLYQFAPRPYTAGQVRELRRCFSHYCRAIEDSVGRSGASERAAQKIAYFQDVLRENGALWELNEWLDEVMTILLQLDVNSTNLVRRTKRYVQSHYDEDLSLTRIAEQIGVNPSYLSRVFSEGEGEGLMLYINKVRVQAAAEYLSTTGLRLYEIAEKVGYRNVEHFSRMFKKIMGKSPREYGAGDGTEQQGKGEKAE